MKAMKKLFAFALAAIMVMAMGITVFATTAPSQDASTSTITVNGLYAGTEVSLYKLATCDDNGNWTLVEWASDAGVTMTTTGSGEYQLDNASNLQNVDFTKVEKIAFATVAEGETSVKFTDVPAGIYYVKASDENVTYSVMVAETFDNSKSYATSTGMVYVAKDATVTAKASEYVLTKVADDTFVKRGDTVTFTITTIYPTFSADDEDKSYQIIDEPTGMDNLAVQSVTIGETKLTEQDYQLTRNEEKGTYTLDLSNTIDESGTYAGQTVTVIYTAVVTADDGYGNAAVANKNGDEITKGKGRVDGYTGCLIITKTDEGNNSLVGAEFTVTKTGENSPVEVVATDVGGVYQVALQSEVDDKKTVTVMSGDDSGKITINGLAEGTYVIKETKAPEGYSINNSIPDAIIKENTNNNVEISVNVSDTKLAALPSTGGIGTTIFTICGVCIMVGAVSLFFVSRKRSA